MKKIYLTIDDGLFDNTRYLIEAIHSHSIPAGFFLVGAHTKSKASRWQLLQELKNGNEIVLCNHSYTHGYEYGNPEVVVQDIQRNQNELVFSNRIARLPGFNAWRTSLANSIAKTHPSIAVNTKSGNTSADAVYAAGFDILGWDIEWERRGNTSNYDAAVFTQRIKAKFNAGTKVAGHMMILTHEQQFSSASSARMLFDFIKMIKETPDFGFAPVTDYPGLRK